MSSVQDPTSYKCEACGADVVYSAEYQSLKCDFCGKVTQLVQDNYQVPTSCDFIIPLSLTDKLLEICAYQYMSSGEYTRDDVIESARILKIRKTYVPFFRYRGNYRGTWSASFGYYRRESYTDWERDSQGVSRPVTKTRTVTDWSPASGTLDGFFDLSGYAGSSLDNSVASYIEKDLNVSEATSDPMRFVAGVEVENISQPQKQTFDERVFHRYEEVVQADAESNAQGDEQRDWNWNANCSYETSSVLSPVCQITFEYDNAEYSLWVDGSDPSRSIGDPLPKDVSRRTSVYVGYLPLAVSLTGLVTLWFFFQDHRAISGNPYSWSIGAIAVAAIYGYFRKVMLLSYSEKTRNALFEFQRASLINISELSSEDQKQIANSFVKPSRTIMSLKTDAISYGLSSVFVGLFSFLYVSTKSDIEQYRPAVASNSVRVQTPNNLPITSNTPSSSQYSPTVPSSLSALSTLDLCRQALDSTQRSWDTGQNYQDAVREANRRSLSVDDCRRAMGIIGNSNSRTAAVAPSQTDGYSRPPPSSSPPQVNSYAQPQQQPESSRNTLLPPSGSTGQPSPQNSASPFVECMRADDGRPVCRDASGQLKFVSEPTFRSQQRMLQRGSQNAQNIDTQDARRIQIRMIQNTDLPGNDLNSQPIPVNSFEDCGELCVRNANCRAFTFNQRASVCFLKSSGATRQSFNGAISGILDGR